MANVNDLSRERALSLAVREECSQSCMTDGAETALHNCFLLPIYLRVRWHLDLGADVA
jgi:hypothetical protein